MDRLLAKAKTGDKVAEEQLFRYLRARFAAIAKKRVGVEEVAEDLAQEACMTILEKYKSANSAAGFRPWAYTVLRMKIGNYLKSQKVRRRRLDGGYSARVDQEAPAPESDYDLRRRLIECFKMLVRVNRRFARVLNLSHQGYQADEICERMRITLSNLYSILSRGRSLLKQCLEEGGL